uniref:C2H2-type domain-containing protein n=1 Tax=Mesocestoides corti TaxID=53468 RepID=A0A5K3FFB7_MESCO
MSQIQAKEVNNAPEALARLPDEQNNLVGTLTKRHLSGLETAPAHGLIYQNAEVIRDVLCVLSNLRGHNLLSPLTTNRQVDRNTLSNHIEAKPINLTRHQQPTYDSQPHHTSSIKGQFICPNCTQDFLNRDALAMHMMESVHSEACATSIGNASKEDRAKKPTTCHHTKITTPTHSSNQARRYIRPPVLTGSNTASFQPLFQSFIKTRPAVDAGVSRPGRKPRRLVFATTEEPRVVPMDPVSKAPMALKRPRSCEPKLSGKWAAEDRPDRASSTPSGAQTVSLSAVMGPPSRICLYEKTEDQVHEVRYLNKLEPPTEKKARTKTLEAIEPVANRGDLKPAPKSAERGPSLPGPFGQWRPPPTEHSATLHYPFICRHCGIGFTDQTLYNLHMGLHTSSNPWQCNMCSKEFSNVYEFAAHALHY